MRVLVEQFFAYAFLCCSGTHTRVNECASPELKTSRRDIIAVLCPRCSKVTIQSKWQNSDPVEDIDSVKVVAGAVFTPVCLNFVIQ